MTPAQKLTLDAIKSYWDEFGFGPTVRDICRMTGRSSPGAMQYMINRLVERGYLARDPYHARSLTVIETRCPHCGAALNGRTDH